jgi:hypothetical protein
MERRPGGGVFVVRKGGLAGAEVARYTHGEVTGHKSRAAFFTRLMMAVPESSKFRGPHTIGQARPCVPP